MLIERRLLGLLADGGFHSGEDLARRLDVSRTAVWKHLSRLRDRQMEIEAVRGRGYRLARPLELLEEKAIRAGLAPDSRWALAKLKVYHETGSTNQVLVEALGDGSIQGHVALAEYQASGRGRGGNRWLSAPGAGLALSVGWHFDGLPRTLSALSLATGVVLAGALRRHGACVGLKWPNDLVYAGAKLGGVLIESRGQLAGPVDVIIGIGINIDLPEGVAAAIGQPVTDMRRILGQAPPRNRLAAAIIGDMLTLLGNYHRRGFEAYIEAWRRLDCSRDKIATLHRRGEDVSGRVVDIDENGNLVLEVAGDLRKFSSGDLSLRVAS